MPSFHFQGKLQKCPSYSLICTRSSKMYFLLVRLFVINKKEYLNIIYICLNGEIFIYNWCVTLPQARVRTGSSLSSMGFFLREENPAVSGVICLWKKNAIVSFAFLNNPNMSMYDSQHLCRGAICSVYWQLPLLQKRKKGKIDTAWGREVCAKAQD